MVTDNSFDVLKKLQVDNKQDPKKEKREIELLREQYENNDRKVAVMMSTFVAVREAREDVDDEMKDLFDKSVDAGHSVLEVFDEIKFKESVITGMQVIKKQEKNIYKLEQEIQEMAQLAHVDVVYNESDEVEKNDSDRDVSVQHAMDNEPLNEKNVESRKEKLNNLTIEDLLAEYDAIVVRVMSDYDETDAINEFITLVTKRMNRGVVNMKDPKKRNIEINRLQKYVVDVIPQIEERIYEAEIDKELKLLKVDDIAYDAFIEKCRAENADNNEILAMTTRRDRFIKKEKTKLNTIRDIQQKKIAIATVQKNIIEAIDAINAKVEQENLKTLIKEFGPMGVIYIDDEGKNINVISYDLENDVQIKFEDADGAQSVDIEGFRDLTKNMKRQDVAEKENRKEVNKFYDKVMADASNNYAGESDQVKSLIASIRTDVRDKVKELKNANSAKEKHEKQIELVDIKLVAAEGLQDMLDSKNLLHKQSQSSINDGEVAVETSENDEDYDKWEKDLNSKFDDDIKLEAEQGETDVTQPVLMGIESLQNKQYREDLESSYYDMLKIFKENNAFNQEIDKATAINLYKDLRNGLQENVGYIPTEDLHTLIKLLEQNFGEGVSILEQIDTKETTDNANDNGSEDVDTMQTLEQNFGKGIVAGIIEQSKLFYENLKAKDELWEDLDEIEIEEELEIYTREIIKEIIASIDDEYKEQNLTDQDILNIYKKVVF